MSKIRSYGNGRCQVAFTKAALEKFNAIKELADAPGESAKKNILKSFGINNSRDAKAIMGDAQAILRNDFPAVVLALFPQAGSFKGAANKATLAYRGLFFRAVMHDGDVTVTSIEYSPNDRSFWVSNSVDIKVVPGSGYTG